MKLFQHKVLGGAIKVTNGPRFFEREGGGHVVNRELEVAATFDTSASGQLAYGCFKNGLAMRAVETVSLFDEDTEQYLIGDIGQLDIAPTAG